MSSGSAQLFFLFLLALGQAHKILVYQPKFALSHVNFMGRIADILVEEGHNVTVLVSEIQPMHDGTKRARIIRVPGGTAIEHTLMSGAVDMFEVEALNVPHVLSIAYLDGVWFSTQCRRLLTDPGLVEMLKEEKYDAFITENFDCCGIGLSHLINAKSLITLTSFPTNDRLLSDLGSPRFPSYDIGLFAPSTDSHSFWNRAYKQYIFFCSIEFLGKAVRMVQAVYDELYPGMPSISEIHSHAAVSFLNSAPLIDSAAPTLNKIVPIGGVAVNAPKPLEKKWLDILALRNRTAIVSFGSIAKSSNMKPIRKNSILNALAKFPDTTFIWKYEELSDDFSKLNASRVPNVILSDWMPQNDLLGDPRVALFITHGGIASCHEASHAGVPVIVVPIFCDQPRNADTLVQHGNGINFNKFDTVHEGKIADAIVSVLGDPSYSANAKKLAEQLRNAPISPRTLLVKHVEYAARFGPSSTSRPAGLDLSYIEYFNVDIFAAFAVLVAIVLYVVFIIISSLVCMIIRIRPAQKEKKQ